MRAITLIPLLFLSACTTTKYHDQSRHYSYSNTQSNYQRNHQEHRQSERYDIPRYEAPREETVFKQTDSEYLTNSRPKQYEVEDVGQFNSKERTSVRFAKHHHPFFPYPFFEQ